MTGKDKDRANTIKSAADRMRKRNEDGEVPHLVMYTHLQNTGFDIVFIGSS